MDSDSKHGARWTDSEVNRFISMIAAGDSREVIAGKIGRTGIAVTAKINALRGADRERLGVGRKRQQRRVSGAAFFLS